MNWKKAIDAINEEKFRIPEGWDSKETIAQELQCSPERVHDLLKNGLTSGAFEAQEFPVWDAKRRLTVRIRCYRQKSESVGIDEGLKQRIAASINRHPGKANNAIAKNFKGVTSAMVQSVRDEL